MRLDNLVYGAFAIAVFAGVLGYGSIFTVAGFSTGILGLIWYWRNT